MRTVALLTRKLELALLETLNFLEHTATEVERLPRICIIHSKNVT